MHPSMARRVGDRSDRWPSPTYSSGYIKPRGLIAWFVYDQEQRSSGKLFHADAKPDDARRVTLLEELDTWIDGVRRRRRGEVMDDEEGPIVAEGRFSAEAIDLDEEGEPIERPETVLSFWIQWSKKNKRKMHPRTYKNYKAAILSLFPVDVPLDAGAIERHLSHRQDDLDLARSTLKKYRTTFSTIAKRYMIPRGLVERDPVANVPLPTMQKEAPQHTHKPAVAVRIIEHVAASKSEIRQEAALLLRWQMLAVMRIGETCRMKWSDITLDGPTPHLRIPAENTKTRTERVIPLAVYSDDSPIGRWQTELRSILVAVREISNRSTYVTRKKANRGGYVWRWRSADVARDVLEEAEQSLELPHATLHRLRATGESYLETTVGLDERTVCDLAGHDPETYRSNYRQRRDLGAFGEVMARLQKGD
jgi:integrase